MLRRLLIRDFVIVKEAEIPFEAGFTVFSGETGAGKSILVDALSLALGARGDAGVIREGAQRTDINAIFDTPSALQDWLEQHDLNTGDELVLRRVIDAQARSRAYVNGVPVTLGQLRELAENLVDIHGQHAHQSLLNTASQRDLLDAQGGHLPLARQVNQEWQQWQRALKTLDQAQANHDTLQQERERLEWQAAELERLALREGEWEAITADHSRLAHAQALLDGAGQALAALDDEHSSALRHLGAAANAISPLLRHDNHLQGIFDAIESARIATREAISDINSYLDKLEPDPSALARAEERLSDIFETARKYKVEPEALASLYEQLQAHLAENTAASNLQQLAEQAEQARDGYMAAAAKLSDARRKTSKNLARQVTQAMQTLAMQGGRFDIKLTAGQPSAHGNETIDFLVAGHSGATPRPLAKVASGGELARLSLALSVIASQAARVPTLIFDEVDTGVGGAVAEVVGRLLKELGGRHQVLCVTHLPQVAACGTQHYQVEKTTAQNATLSTIRILDQQGRVDEIARMLGGLTITDTTRKHASEMLAG